MNEEQYKKLCRACDEILLSKEAGLSRIAIPWLHVLNEHPENIKKYVALFGKEHSVVKPAFLQFFLQSFKSLARISRIPKRPSMSNNRPIVFISHLLNSAQVGNPVDFYFGNLPVDLLKEGRAVVIASLVHCKYDYSWFGENYINDVVPLGSFISAEDIAESVAFLVSERAKNITGVILKVDGGQSI